MDGFCQQEAAFNTSSTQCTTGMFQACGIRLLLTCLYNSDMTLLFPNPAPHRNKHVDPSVCKKKQPFIPQGRWKELHPLSSGIQPRPLRLSGRAVLEVNLSPTAPLQQLSRLWFPWRVGRGMLTAPESVSGPETAWQARVSAELLEIGCLHPSAATERVRRPRGVQARRGMLPGSEPCSCLPKAPPRWAATGKGSA